MPELGELVTTQRVFGLDLLIQSVGSLTAAVDNLRKEVHDRMTSVENQITALSAALTNIGDDIARIKAQLDAALLDVQGQIDTAVQDRLQAVSDSLQPIVDRAQGIAAETPEPTTP